MGMTLWLHTLEGDDLSRDSDDHSWMHRLTEELDAICEREGVTRLSEFFDYSEINEADFAMGDELAEFGDFDDDEFLAGGDDVGAGADEEEEGMFADPLSAAAGSPGEPGDDDAGEAAVPSWFPASEGVTTVATLLEAVRGGALAADVGERDAEALARELESCLERLQETAAHDGKFHLVVVE